jgi:hypothetical protein
MSLKTLFTITIVLAVGISLHAAEPVDLFNGKTLNGWQRQQGIAEFRVEDGMIIGKTVNDAGNTFLCTTKHFADFDLTFDVQFLGKPVNSGCVIRSLVRKKDGEKRYIKKGNVYGPQVEIEASGPRGSESGNIYGQGLGTDFLKPKVGRVKAIKDTEWNHIRILAEGPRIRTWINGQPIADITNHEIYKAHSTGMIGLQVHGVKNFTEPLKDRRSLANVRKLRRGRTPPRAGAGPHHTRKWHPSPHHRRVVKAAVAIRLLGRPNLPPRLKLRNWPSFVVADCHPGRTKRRQTVKMHCTPPFARVARIRLSPKAICCRSEPGPRLRRGKKVENDLHRLRGAANALRGRLLLGRGSNREQH